MTDHLDITTPKPRRLAIYARGEDSQAQTRECEARALADGFALHQVYTDTGPAAAEGLGSRAALAQLLAALSRGEAEGLMVARLSALSRDLIMQEVIRSDLIRRGLWVLSCTDESSPARSLAEHTVAALVSYTAQAKVLRMAEARASQAREGIYLGGDTPYGWVREGTTVVAEPAEQQVIALMQRRRRAGTGWTAIASELNRRAYPTRRGGHWSAQTVARVSARG